MLSYAEGSNVPDDEHTADAEKLRPLIAAGRQLWVVRAAPKAAAAGRPSSASQRSAQHRAPLRRWRVGPGEQWQTDPAQPRAPSALRTVPSAAVSRTRRFFP